ncbi:Ni/Fe hydrogenase subunit alpha [Desulfonatronovibrio hydrogenovorans]|uniref:Ni/Fe hydrogenase subunit alpha n=1 Tax=Desulfonatronovibrio hydrogenovorans TaxID=53245 RepID=UPI00048D0EFB|nr:Ni/Fe hydrogenase subunit alpha [Desulfonatronovibrio hydrogenovorans]
MGKTLNIAPITRIEGHASVAIHLDDSGNVSDAKMHVLSLRGFEQFVLGRPVEEVPRIVPRICGICPWHHHLASNKAADACLGVELPPTGRKLRELCQMMAYIPDKILHFYFLAAPDFVLGPDADYSVRNVVGIVGANPELAKKVVHMRYKGQMLLEKFAGKVIHPIAGVVGGFSKPLLEDERKEILAGIQELKDFCVFTIKFAREEVFPKYLDAVKILGVFPSGYLGTVRPSDGALELYDGELRMMDKDGNFDQFTYPEYVDHIGEHTEPWSYLKFPYAKKHGALKLDENDPVGVYRANCLARINVCDKMATPLAQEELDIFRKEFGRPTHLTLLYHWARLIELVQACEKAEELLNDPEITGREHRAKNIQPRAGDGVGCVEAPRGTLIHHYKTDDNGLVTMANLIVGTTHNNAPMNLSVKQAAKALIKDGKYDQGILNRVEMAIRAYDP